MEFKYNNNQDIQENLRMLIKKSDYSMNDLAKRLNMTRQNLYNLLNLKKNINNDDIKKLLDCLDYDLYLKFKSKKEESYFTETLAIDNGDLNTIQSLENFKNDLNDYIDKVIDRKIQESENSNFTEKMNELQEDDELVLTDDEIVLILDDLEKNSHISLEKYQKEEKGIREKTIDKLKNILKKDKSSNEQMYKCLKKIRR
ncbi:helix-turn-helix transcriptional regulator [uncultured Thomasclavelia sp.]|uniref:helix-turn-helix domain-containing protein n=1 Tax=uncultured Thomasclavelia sp. TaxID=3025759 RepID=UPI0025FDC5D0|nr:helix-turn-helix transcriptional regulator [uncultured Thomasclavelia sp.]